MKVCGIVVEYNPMHNGHIYHIQKSKELSSCSHLVAIMSGNFVQRGEPAIVNKWARAQMAIENGVDLVIELPLINSISSAENFCYGAIKILNSLNIIDNICFGSETDNINILSTIADILLSEPDEYKNYLHKSLKEGVSFPRAREIAVSNYISNNNMFSSEEYTSINQLISSPNNILAIEYIKSIKRLKSNITPLSIKRVVNHYSQEDLSGEISSATSIRKNICDLNSISSSMPKINHKILTNNFKEGLGPITLDNFSKIILYNLRKSSPEYISSLLDVSEGLEYKIKRSCEDTSNINELLDSISSKRYTKTRIQRILMYSLFGITKDIFKVTKDPSYIRVLGFNNKGREILNKIKKTSSMPIITMPSSRDLTTLKWDILSTDIYSLAYSNDFYGKSKKDLKTPPIYLNK